MGIRPAWLGTQAIAHFSMHFFLARRKIGLKLSYEANKLLPEVSQYECATFAQEELLGTHHSPHSSLATLSLQGL